MPFNVGGQAVIEGVMMRSADRVSTAVRRINGSILVKSEEYKPFVKRHLRFDIPIIRGAIAFFEMLLLGIKTLNFSAEVAARDADEAMPGKPRKLKSDSGGLFSFSLILTAIVAMGVGVLIFFFVPIALTSLLKGNDGAFAFNIIAGIIRMAMFVLYIYIISKFKEIKRIFSYHGAEHKSIYAYEAGQELTPENVRIYSTKHPRCGTSFILIVALLAILTYSISDTIFALIANRAPYLLERFIVHFSLLPLVAGGSYELLKLSAKKVDNPLTALLVKPGLWLQMITTQEPDDGMLEVAICALTHSLGGDYPGCVVYDGELKSVRIPNESVR